MNMGTVARWNPNSAQPATSGSSAALIREGMPTSSSHAASNRSRAACSSILMYIYIITVI